MQKDKGLVLVLGACVVVTAALLTGCRGDSRSELAKATDTARRLYDRACSELHDPVHKVGERYVPIMEKIAVPDGNEIKPLPYGAINPNVDDVLKQAIGGLSAARSAGKDAPAPDVAEAEVMLARLHALQAYRYGVEAAQKRDEAWGVLRELENAAIEMGDHGKRIANCDALLSVSDPSLDAMAAKGKTDEAAAQARITDLKGKISGLQKEKATLQAENEALLGAARKLRVDSQLADEFKGIELFDQAKVKEDKATANSVRLTEVEDQIQFLNSQIATFELDVAAAGKESATAAKIAEDRAQRKADVQKQRGEFAALLTGAQQRAEAAAGKVAGICQGAADLETKALDAYAKADAQYEAYKNMTTERPSSDDATPPTAPTVVAQLGDMRMERANLGVRRLALQSRISEATDRVAKLWAGLPVQKDPPAVIGQVAGYLPDGKKAASQARDDFRWAAKSYEKAADLLKAPQQVWAYRLQTAAAYTALYRLTGEGEDQQKGNAALDALGEEERSRFIAEHAAHFRKLLAAAPSGAGGAPTSAPAIP